MRIVKNAVPVVYMVFMLTSLLHPRSALASVFYVDPRNGSPDNDGSKEHPWLTLEQVLNDNLIQGRQCSSLPYATDCEMVIKNPNAPVKPGDTIRLLSGYHGRITIQDAFLEVPITVEAEQGEVPAIKSLRCLGASNWVFRGLSISPSYAQPYEKIQDLVMLENHGFHGPCKQITIEDCDLFSMQDTSIWTKDDWNNFACSGIAVQGIDCTIENNKLKNVEFGISVSGPNAVIKNNTIENFSGDGLRGLGDYGLFEHNLVMNCYDVNENHDDGFQSWSVGPDGVGTGEIRGVVLRANTIINYTDPDQPFRGTLQGIGCFDGFYTDWVVENNVIITDHWHGITFLGARNVKISNNTVLDINQQQPGPAWIKISPHKNGTTSSGCIVRNNIVMSLEVDDSAKADHNLVVDFDWARRFFTDYPGNDVHLTSDSPAIDSGSSDQAPGVDHDGISRPQGAGVDIGAYELSDQSSHDAGPDANSGSDASTEDAGNLGEGVSGGDISDGTEVNDNRPGEDQVGSQDEGDDTDVRVTSEGCTCSSKPCDNGILFLFFAVISFFAGKPRRYAK